MEIPVTEFNAKCLRLLAKMGATREPIIITKRAKPVAKVVPVEQEGQPPNHFRYMAGTPTIGGDIVSPSALKSGSNAASAGRSTGPTA